jgi:hypothetical protein
MNMVIVVEIVVGILVLALAVRFAVRDARQRRGVTEPAGTGEAPVRGGEREGEEVAAVSASSTAPEPPADAR